MKVVLTNPTGLDVTAAVSFSAADGQIAQPFTVDWGDGSAVQQLAGGAVGAGHTYAKAGWYTVTVRSNNTSVRQRVEAGTPVYPAFGAHEARRREELEEDTELILGVTGKLP